MNATLLTRRDILRLGGAFALAQATTYAAGAIGGQATGVVAYRRSHRRKRGRASNAALAHAGNRVYVDPTSARNDPAHPGDYADVVPITVDRDLHDEWFGRGARVVDLRQYYSSTTQPAPELIHIMDGIGAEFSAGSADSFVSPLGELARLTEFTLTATEDLTLHSVRVVYTGPGPAPTVAPGGWVHLGKGKHRVVLTRAIMPLHWLKLTFRVTGRQSGLGADIRVWLAHHPCNIDQDRAVTISDVGAYGQEWRRKLRPALVNTDGGDRPGDGLPVISASDPGAFGAHFNGFAVGGATRAWGGTILPPKPR